MYEDHVEFCGFVVEHLFSTKMPWVHRGILAIITRKTDFLLKYGELDKIVDHFVWREDPTDEESPEHSIFTLVKDDDGNVISSTEGTTSTTLVADGTRRLAVDAFMSGGTITVAPTPTRESFSAFAHARGAGSGVQGPTVSVPGGVVLVL